MTKPLKERLRTGMFAPSVGPMEDRTTKEAANRISTLEAEVERLRTDCERLISSEIVSYCESCGAWLLSDDDFVSGEDVSGCWSAMTDEPSKRERPCYAYRVGKLDARAALEGSPPDGKG